MSADFYNVIVSQSNSNGDCFLSYTGTTGCTVVEECDLQTSIVANCIDEDNIEFIITIEGSSEYTLFIDGELGSELIMTGLVEGVTLLALFLIQTYNFFGYNIFIQDEISNAFECFESTFISRNCDEDCDFTAGYGIICNSDGTFDIELTIEGSSTYDIFSEFGADPLINVTEGIYILGPYPNDFFFFFNIFDNQNLGCFQDVFGVADCEADLECDLNANIGIECVEGEGSFVVEVSITGSDTYSIFNGDELVLEGVGEGAYFIGPFENGNFNISIVNTSNNLCTQDFSGGFFCEPPPECDMEVDFTPVCNVDNSGYLFK